MCKCEEKFLEAIRKDDKVFSCDGLKRMFNMESMEEIITYPVSFKKSNVHKKDECYKKDFYTYLTMKYCPFCGKKY